MDYSLALFLCPFFLATAGIFAQPAVTRATGLDFDYDEYNNLPIQSKFADSYPMKLIVTGR